MFLSERLLKGEEYISVIGLGYVGIQTALAFSRKAKVIGFDLDSDKINLYKSGIDPTGEIGNDAVISCSIEFTDDVDSLKKAKFHIVAVPTPVKVDKTPEPSNIENACVILGRRLKRGSIVVFESTVYPGMTEEVCIPILERESGMKCGVDFFVGYSPERINPGDKNHRFENIKKIVSGIDGKTLEEISRLYESVISAGIHKAPSIKVAEAAKIIENTQRDINIAFMNEISVIFENMDIDTKSVLEAAGTKWNFLKFFPGLVGGQCIGVDPYYLIHKAKSLGCDSKVMSAARFVNDSMGEYVGEKTVSFLLKEKKNPSESKIAIMGLTFKENCPDVRNSKVFDIVKKLREFGAKPLVYDPVANSKDAKIHYDIDLCSKSDLSSLDAIIFAVSHGEFERYTKAEIDSFFGNETKILIDVKGIYDRKEFEDSGYVYWRL